jgi:hypothetical protein
MKHEMLSKSIFNEKPVMVKGIQAGTAITESGAKIQVAMVRRDSVDIQISGWSFYARDLRATATLFVDMADILEQGNGR